MRLRFTVLFVATLCIGVLLIWLTYAFWTRRLAETLVCTEHVGKSDALVLENFDPPDYPVFKRAAELHKMGVADKIFVPVLGENDLQTANEVSKGIAEVMARASGLSTMELIPIQLNEPITLNAVKQILVVLMKEHVTSVVVVAPAFRSERAWLVHRAVLAPAGIQVGCAPAFGFRTQHNWTRSWHGMENVSEQLVKLMYYRFWVLL